MASVQRIHALAQEANADRTLLPMFAASAALLGVLPKKTEVDEALAGAVDALVAMRLEMLKAKNFAEADKIRDELSAKGIQLKDGKDAATGERVTTWELKR
ncbi:Cysteine--tRNA ligase [compost metagenome]